MTESDLFSPESNDESTSGSSEEVTESGTWTGSGDDLPELEELTPELVEEEAIRGDFMLRGAAVLLAVLFGWGQISDSRVLVHIRSGEHMRANGFVPPRVDVFSIAKEGQATANVSWLFDHVVSLVWKLGEAQGLTIFKAVMAAFIAWQLTRISVPGLPTWWNSICAVFALAACASDLMPVTDLMTLLGIVLTLRLLHNAFEGQVDGLTWKVPLLIAIWSNLDPRAWLGLVALILFSAGRSFAKTPGDTRPGAAPSVLWAAAGISAVALLINPFPTASVLSVVQTYWVDYPALRALNPLDATTVGLLDGRTEYYSLVNDAAWDGFEFSYVAAMMIILFAVLALVSCRDRREAPWAFVLAGFAVLAVVSMHELAAAALAAAVVAGTAGQRWYQKTFPQEYTTRSSEVMFSRAGRAVTVFSFALLGFLVVTDRLPTRTAVGNGFTDDLQTSIDAFDSQLQELPEDARVLHTRPDLGDFLIWNNRKSYIDTRIRPFGPPDAPDSGTQRFLKLRKGMLETAESAVRSLQSGERTASTGTENESELTLDLTAEFRKDGITHAIAGLYPPVSPHYRTLGALSLDTESWLMTSLGSSAAVFAWLKNSGGSEYLEPFDLKAAAFRDVEPVNEFRFEYAREKGFYHRYLYHTRAAVPEGLRIARHLLRASQTPEAIITAIRAVNRLVTRDEQNAEGFFVLALAYSRLQNWESQVVQQSGGRNAADMRYMQIIMAARQAVTIDPGHGGAWNLLYRVYAQRGRIDQALECLAKAMPSLESAQTSAAGSRAAQQELIEQLRDVEKQLAQAVAQVEEQLEEALAQELAVEPAVLARQKHAIAENVARAGHIGAALELLQNNQEGLREAPEIFPRAEAMRGQLLLETGALQEGYELFLQLDSMAQEQSESDSNVYPWSTMSFVAQVALGNYPNATEGMATLVSNLRTQGSSPVITGAALLTMPLVAPIETSLRSTVVTRWPMAQLVHCRIPMQTVPNSLTEPRFMQAMAELEGGLVDAARITLQAIVTEYGETPYRPLAVAYLARLEEDMQGFITNNWIDIWEDWSEPEFEVVPVEALVTEEPVTEEPVTEEPVTEEPVTEEPVTEEPVTEEPVTEEPVTEEPVTEEPVTEEPVTEEPVTEEPVTEEPVTEEPVTEEPVTEEPVTEEPVTEEPVTEEPVTEEPVTEEPVTEEPVTEEPVTEEPVTEEETQKSDS